MTLATLDRIERRSGDLLVLDRLEAVRGAMTEEANSRSPDRLGELQARESALGRELAEAYERWENST